MTENMPTLVNHHVLSADTSDCWSRNSDATYLLPTDDQLGQLVDSLCDSFVSVQTSTDSQETSSTVSVDNSIGEESVGGTNQTFNSPDSPEIRYEPECETEEQISKKTDDRINSGILKPSRTSAEKRSSANGNLNLMIMQTNRSLEHLVEKRKSLELLVQVHHNVANINYSFTYSPRLPDAPTKVDRLMYDINQERCRVLGLVSALEKTINSFISTTTKEEIRQLLSGFGTAIVDVIKERQCEISYNCNGPNYEAGVRKLIKLLQIVNRFTRKMDTALWCIEVKEQVDLVKSQKSISKLAYKASVDTKDLSGSIGTAKKNWRENRISESVGRGLKTPVGIKSSVPNGLPVVTRKSRQYPVGVTQQPTSIQQTLPSSPRQKRRSAMQLIAQQQRAEIFQRYCSSLRNDHNSYLQ